MMLNDIWSKYLRLVYRVMVAHAPDEGLAAGVGGLGDAGSLDASTGHHLAGAERDGRGTGGGRDGGSARGDAGAASESDGRLRHDGGRGGDSGHFFLKCCETKVNLLVRGNALFDILSRRLLLRVPPNDVFQKKCVAAGDSRTCEPEKAH